jgi:hypothetical protein
VLLVSFKKTKLPGFHGSPQPAHRSTFRGHEKSLKTIHAHAQEIKQSKPHQPSNHGLLSRYGDCKQEIGVAHPFGSAQPKVTYLRLSDYHLLDLYCLLP